jgi:hypothetical protein
VSPATGAKEIDMSFHDLKFKIFCDRTHRKNYWYVLSGGSFVAGPFDTKGDTVIWIRDNQE